MPNILLIGEEGREAQELSAQIRQFGYVVSQCHDTDEALDRALEEQPAALLVGIEAGENGVRKIESIEAQKASDPTMPPVIFLASDPEIATRLAAVRAGWPERRLVLAFQPHRYSRTRDLFDDFIQVLCEVDALVIGEVYAAGEAPISGADGRAGPAQHVIRHL